MHSTDEPVGAHDSGAGYSWEVLRTAPNGETLVTESGGGMLGAPAEATNRICETHLEAATALFEWICDDFRMGYRTAVLEARVAGRADPKPEAVRAALSVRDARGKEVVTLSAALTYPPVTGRDLADFRRRQRLRTKGKPPRAADPHLDRLIRHLRLEAESVREEVPDLDHCREQLDLAKNTVEAASAAKIRAEATGDSAEAAHAAASLARWRPRVARWTGYLELTTEAYVDAAAVEAEADRLAHAPTSEG
ncbi:hypothetical protein D5S18_14630 [Nocardia panacis]|uniref:Uncharacterized protein n=1 Tax=Nocardia panacis TaxID=2340916 RepID=A0A3A4KFM0_9NOCA|nr:hypothetical protein [Nocardia panacis]RJO74708.1 hypothetical protein D5S18_14630 [Nocardia panacis]